MQRHGSISKLLHETTNSLAIQKAKTMNPDPDSNSPINLSLKHFGHQSNHTWWPPRSVSVTNHIKPSHTQRWIVHGSRPSPRGTKRKTLDDYVKEYPDFKAIVVRVNAGEHPVKCLVCRFCNRSIGCRSDRIKEHLKSKRHEQFKMEALQNPGNVSSKPEFKIPKQTFTLPNTQEEELTMPKHELIHIKSGNYDFTKMAKYSKFLYEQHFTDIILWCEMRTIKCHRLVLSACSKYFEDILTDKEANDDDDPHPILLLSNIKFWEIEALIEFMYKGEVIIHAENLEAFVQAGQHLGIQDFVLPLESQN